MKSKLPESGTTIFTVMSRLAAEYGAINLGQGFPGFPVDPLLIEEVSKAMREGHNQYAPMPGIMALREAISAKMQRSSGHLWNPETEITITSGATQALFTAITALVHPGDEVILFAPAYDSYAPAVLLQGATPVWVRLSYPDYRIPWDEVARRCSPRTRMIVINNPHNPTGSVLSASDMSHLEALAARHNLIVLSDEVYEHLVFDGRTHQSASSFPGLAERSVITFSFGKTFHATGWKMGYAIAPEHLMTEFRKVHQYNVFASNHPTQQALARYLRDEQHYASLPAFFQSRRDFFFRGLKDVGFECTPCQGTYFQLVRVGGTGESDVEIARRWIREFGVASIPVSAFYPDQFDEGILRFCFAKPEEELQSALARLALTRDAEPGRTP